TPLAEADGQRFAVPLVAVPILRAGLAMLEAVTELFPEVAVGYIGLERDHATFQPSTYYSKLPPLEGSYVLLLDPMLATGGRRAAPSRASCAAAPPCGGPPAPRRPPAAACSRPGRPGSRCCRWWPRRRGWSIWPASTP